MKIKTKSFVGDNEKKIVEDFHKFILKNFRNGIMSGFNIINFDCPLIQSRFIKYNLDRLPIFGKKFDYLDSRDLLGGLNSKGTLQDYLTFFGMEGKYNEYNGADVQGLWERGEWSEIKKYVEQDSHIEHMLLMKILKFMKKIYNIENIVTFDIEVVAPVESINTDLEKPIYDKCLDEYRISIEGCEKSGIPPKYKQQKTIDEYLDPKNKKYSFDFEKIMNKYNDDIEKVKKEAIFNKFKNKIVAISCSWTEEEELF